MPNVGSRKSPIVEIGDLFVLTSGLLSCLGWILAGCGWLNRIGYVVGLAVVVGVTICWRRDVPLLPVRSWQYEWRRLKGRLRRHPVTWCFLVIFGAAVAGGMIYAPSNYDALSYRIPQLCHWYSTGHWHWIDCINDRVNIASPGFNWLVAPMFALTQSDRMWFVVNTLSFALLPGYLFQLLRGCGVGGRGAVWWMWLIPCGYTYALQAGSIANDLTGTFFVVASLAIAVRARATQRTSDLCLATISAAMATGIKNTNVPLMLPFVVALLPSWRLIFLRPWLCAACVGVSFFASCLPTVALNIRQTGYWSGDPGDKQLVRPPNSLSGLASNAVQITVSALQPPVFPGAGKFNAALAETLKHNRFGDLCRQTYRFDPKWVEMPSEDVAGVGPGVFLGAILMMVGSARSSGKRSKGSANLLLFVFSVWTALLFHLSVFTSEAIGRLVSPYWPLLLLPVIIFASGRSFRRLRLMNWAIAAAAGLSLPPLLLLPARPLLPIREVVKAKRNSAGAFAGHVLAVYDTFAMRPYALQPLLDRIPAGSTDVLWFGGGGDDVEGTAWKPYGARVIKQLTPRKIDDGDLEEGAIAILSSRGIRERFDLTVDEFVARVRGEILSREDLLLRASTGPEPWCLVRMHPAR